MRLRSVADGTSYPATEIRWHDDTGNLLEVELDISPLDKTLFDRRLGSYQHPIASGVWRYRELMPSFPDDSIVTKPEGNTNLYYDQRLNDIAGTDVWFKHEGENPTGSFKDRGMTAGISHACWVGATAVACASTGNTSASLASYAAAADLPAIVFIPEGNIAAAKLAQTVAYGAHVIQVRGDFDAAMRLVREASAQMGVYLLNSLNPFRLEGQKSILFESLQQLDWKLPDWIIVPGGNLGNVSALGKGLREAMLAGLIDSMPKVGVVQAAGSAPFAAAFQNNFGDLEPVEAVTVASAIRIGNPVNYQKARQVIQESEGIVLSVTDDELMIAKAQIDGVGIGCEPASATGLAGIRHLVADGVIAPGERVLTYLTGNLMKDSDAVIDYHLGEQIQPMANRVLVIDPDMDAVRQALNEIL